MHVYIYICIPWEFKDYWLNDLSFNRVLVGFYSKTVPLNEILLMVFDLKGIDFFVWLTHLLQIPSHQLDVSKNRETPQNGCFIMENLIKMDDLGVPRFFETLNSCNNWCKIFSGQTTSGAQDWHDCLCTWRQFFCWHFNQSLIHCVLSPQEKNMVVSSKHW